MSLGKEKERKAAARLQAVDGKWPNEFPEVTEIGRVGHLDEKKVPFDILTRHYAGENKSSSSKAKNPGHRISKDTLQKVQKGADKFDQDWVYIVNLPYCEDGHMISERRHFRLMVAFEWLIDPSKVAVLEGSEPSDLISMIDEEIDKRLSKISKRYQ